VGLEWLFVDGLAGKLVAELWRWIGINPVWAISLRAEVGLRLRAGQRTPNAFSIGECRAFGAGTERGRGSAGSVGRAARDG